jgi:hypothetical protein
MKAMMKSAVNALYKPLWNLDHYCPHEMFPDRERFVIEVSTGPTTSAIADGVGFGSELGERRVRRSEND